MAIQIRRGLYDDFEPAKMLPGEWAVSIDSDKDRQIVWMCFAPGVTKRMGTYEDFKQQITEMLQPYEDEFESVFYQIEQMAETTQSNSDTVLQIRDDVINTYLPQMLEYYNKAKENSQVAQSYAVGSGGVRENETVDNAKYYYEQAKRISQGMSGLIPMGTIAFGDLSNTDNQVAKYMFNISEAFVTDETFKEGAGFTYPEGTNVYRTNDGYWDCLAGAFLTLTGDSKDNVVTFASDDAEDPTEWTTVEKMTSGETHSTLFRKISTMFKNGRYLNKSLGDVESKLSQLEVQNIRDVVIPLLLSDWVADDDHYIQTVSVEGLDGNCNPGIMLSSVNDEATEDELYSYSCISAVVVNEGNIKFIASEIPPISFTVIAKGVIASENDTVATVTALVGRVSELESAIDELDSDISATNTCLGNMMSNGGGATAHVTIGSDTVLHTIYTSTASVARTYFITAVVKHECKSCDIASAIKVNGVVVCTDQKRATSEYTPMTTLQILKYLKVGDVVEVCAAQKSGASAVIDCTYTYSYTMV